MKKIYIPIVLSLLGSCGGSGGGSGSGTTTTTTSTTYNAQFIDAPVKGLSMVSVTNGTTVVTTDNGKFNCTKGEELQVKVAGLLLGTAYCDTVIFLQDVTPVAGSTIEALAAVIQSFSEEKSNGDLDLTTPSFTSNELASLDLTVSDNALYTAISAIISGRTNPVTITAITVTDATNEMQSQEVTHGVLSSTELAKYSSFLTAGNNQTVSLNPQAGNHANCLPDVTLTYNLSVSSGVYKLTGSQVTSSNATSDQIPQTQMASEAFSVLKKLISKADIYAGSQKNVTGSSTQSGLRASMSNNSITLTKDAGAYPTNYRPKVKLSVTPNSNQDASVTFEYTALRVATVTGNQYDLTEVTCKYEN